MKNTLTVYSDKRYIILWLCSFLTFGSLFFIISHFEDFFKEFSIKPPFKISSGLAVLLFSITAGCTRFFTVKLTNKYGEYKVIVGSILINFISCFGYYISSFFVSYSITIYIFLSFRILHGFSLIFQPVSTAIITGIFLKSQRGRFLSAFSLSASIAIGLFPMLSRLLDNHFSEIFLVASMFPLAALLLMMFYPRSSTDKKQNDDSNSVLFKESFPEKIYSPILITFLISIIYGSLIVLSIKMEKDIENEGIPEGFFFLVITIVSVFIRLITGKYFDKINRLVLLMISAFCATLTMIIFSFDRSLILFILGAFIFGVSRCIFTPITWAWIADVVPDETKEYCYSINTFSTEIGIGIGALMASIEYPEFINKYLIFAIFPAFSFIYLLSLYKFYNKTF
ncbi:MFS transporter [Runella sp.]|uniref:MFS transporter n=1 Tax=Runella sp. TaxID=1960881 RepID=UPI003D105998